MLFIAMHAKLTAEPLVAIQLFGLEAFMENLCPVRSASEKEAIATEGRESVMHDCFVRIIRRQCGAEVPNRK
jgi:hypothetical protein